MKVALIVAMAENGVIGRNNQLPWQIPEDLKYFRKVTMGKPVIMGRKTFESIGRPLPGRTNIVISHQKNLDLPDGVELAGSVDEALAFSREACQKNDAGECMIIGGEQIYALFMPVADKLYLTQVHANIEGDACFSSFNEDEWLLIDKEDHVPVEEDSYGYSFCVLEKMH